MKASAIDKLYSTRAGNIYWVADAVVDTMREEEGLRSSGETSSEIALVDMISRHKRRRHPKAHRCASFASKYCHFFVAGREFPIYDSFALVAVNQVLGKQQRGLTPNRSEYRDFCERITRVRTRNGLEHVGTRELDRFLWLWGQWLAQQGNSERVINADVYEALFESTDPTILQHVQALKPQIERME